MSGGAGPNTERTSVGPSRPAPANLLPRLMLVTDQDAEDPLTPLVRALTGEHVDATRVLVQVRLARWDGVARRAACQALSDTGAAVVVNDDPALARELNLVVHLPERAGTVYAARAELSPHALVGRSCHDAEGLARAEEEGATYVTLGPVGAVPHKGAGRGVAWLTRLAQHTSLPVLALGGVSLQDVRPLRDGGVYGVAVMRAVPGAADPAELVRTLLDLTR